MPTRQGVVLLIFYCAMSKGAAALQTIMSIIGTVIDSGYCLAMIGRPLLDCPIHDTTDNDHGSTITLQKAIKLHASFQINVVVINALPASPIFY